MYRSTIANKIRQHQGTKHMRCNAKQNRNRNLVLSFVAGEMQLRGITPSMLTQGMNIKITHLLHMFFVGHLSSHLKHAICRELGFEDWEELTEAALSVDA